MNKRNKPKKVPAIPPDDYEGSQAGWMIELQQRGLWSGRGWHGDVYITKQEWDAVLEKCEAD